MKTGTADEVGRQTVAMKGISQHQLHGLELTGAFRLLNIVKGISETVYLQSF
jgi:hypothetical protein